MSGSKDFMYGESPKGLRRNGRKNLILSFNIDQIRFKNEHLTLLMSLNHHCFSEGFWKGKIRTFQKLLGNYPHPCD